MSFSDIMGKLEVLLMGVIKDLSKVNRGNKAAAQRVRVGTIKLEKVSKEFRKESVKAEKRGKLKRKGASSAKKKLKKKKR